MTLIQKPNFLAINKDKEARSICIVVSFSLYENMTIECSEFTWACSVITICGPRNKSWKYSDDRRICLATFLSLIFTYTQFATTDSELNKKFKIDTQKIGILFKITNRHKGMAHNLFHTRLQWQSAYHRLIDIILRLRV